MSFGIECSLKSLYSNRHPHKKDGANIERFSSTKTTSSSTTCDHKSLIRLNWSDSFSLHGSSSNRICLILCYACVVEKIITLDILLSRKIQRRCESLLGLKERWTLESVNTDYGRSRQRMERIAASTGTRKKVLLFFENASCETRL